MMEERQKSSKTVFKERVKNWKNDERKHHLKLLEKKYEKDTKDVEIQELGLKLFLENPFPLNPNFEYERDPEYVKKKAEIQKRLTEEKIEQMKEEIEYTDWKISYLKRKLGDKQ